MCEMLTSRHFAIQAGRLLHIDGVALERELLGDES